MDTIIRRPGRLILFIGSRAGLRWQNFGIHCFVLRLKNFIYVVLEYVQTSVCEGAYRTTLGLSEEMARSGSRAGKQHQVRIIGGRWRGRKLAFSPASGLRPTGDRIRETLFNWLAAYMQGARCADSVCRQRRTGAGGTFQRSRHCDFVDNSTTSLAQVSDHLKTLDAVSRGACHPLLRSSFWR